MPAIDFGPISLFYEDISGTGEKPLLLIHELGGSSASWHATIPHFAPNRRLIIPDLRGAGRSEKPPIPFDLSSVTDDLAALLAALRVQACDVLGAALGAFVGASLALRHPTLVRRLILCAVAESVSPDVDEYLTRRAARIRTQGMRVAADESLKNAFPDPHGEVRAAYRPLWLANDPAAYAELSLALARLRMTPADWQRITHPTLVLSGAQDFVWPPDIGQAVAALIPNAIFATLPQAGHFPHLQSPAELAARAREFLG
jgi:3-oxoadipate enol-lactonase